MFLNVNIFLDLTICGSKDTGRRNKNHIKVRGLLLEISLRKVTFFRTQFFSLFDTYPCFIMKYLLDCLRHLLKKICTNVIRVVFIYYKDGLLTYLRTAWICLDYGSFVHEQFDNSNWVKSQSGKSWFFKPIQLVRHLTYLPVKSLHGLSMPFYQVAQQRPLATNCKVSV